MMWNFNQLTGWKSRRCYRTDWQQLPGIGSWLTRHVVGRVLCTLVWSL